MTKHGRLVAAGSVVGLALMVAAPALAQEVNIYTSNPVQSIEAITEVARTAMPDVQLNAITGGSGVLLRRIESEADKVQADIFWSSSANTLGAFESLFESYDSPALAAIPEGLHYPGNRFLPTNVHVSVIMVNEDLLGDLPMPETWSDLADPVYQGKITVPDPANSSTGYTILWGARELLDEAAFQALAGNVVVTGSSSAVPRGVAMGEYPIGLTFEATAYAYIDGGQDELKLVYPSEGTFVTPEYLGLVAGAPAGDVARQAVDMLLSAEAQTALLVNGFRRPSRSDIEVSKYLALPELADVEVFAVDEAAAANEREPFLEMIRSIAGVAQ
ncbi:MAG: extracellular solute-binding protein [Geminicoccaceae bacterium]|jgi:iron(III) transport system substrate-binding protein|nr:extracellular solute-binding protein [Geminicoccaceae bacterium]